jgi:formylglycine-generating enzyme required for sulfatase activity
MWAAWDTVSRGMIPEKELSSKPIKLRNALIFYLGHIPTFLDIHLARACGRGPTQPAYFWKIFERGIDPDVENPEQCHAHSEIPDSWPQVTEILDFQAKIRGQVNDLYASGIVETDPKVAKAMWIAFEHEAMHLETLLYMLIQSERILPPPGTVAPDFEALAQLSKVQAVENEWFDVPEQDVALGLNDSDDPSGEKRFFGWDVEKPQRTVHVPSFSAKARPITNGEYAQYLTATAKSTIPASWCEYQYSNDSSSYTKKRDSVMNGANGHGNGANSQVNGTNYAAAHGKYVRTVYGSVPLEFALDWPVIASYDELAGCAQWMGGRIPTEAEVRSIYSYVDRSKSKDVEKALGKTIPAVNR